MSGTGPRRWQPTRWIARHPWLVLLAGAALTLLATAQLLQPDGSLRLRIDPSVHTLVVPGIPAQATEDEIERRFGHREQVVVVVRTADIFAPESLDAVSALSRELYALPGVESVQSLTTTALPRRSGDMLTFERLGEQPVTPAQRAAALANPLIRDQLVAGDGRATAIVVDLDTDDDAQLRALGLPQRILDLAEGYATSALQVHVTGSPVLRAATSAAVVDQLAWVIPAIAVLMSVFLALVFRSIRGVALPLVIVAVALLWTLGTMAVLGLSLNLITCLVPPLVVTMGLAYCAHIVSEFDALQRGAEQRSRPEQSLELLRSMSSPVALTAFTTMIGLLALCISPLPAVRDFALLSALGVVYSAVLALTLAPALLQIFARPRHRPKARADWFERLAHRLGRFDTRYRRSILIVAALVLLSALAAGSRVHVGDQFIGVFEPGARVRADYEAANAALGGVTPMNILIDGYAGGVLTDPDIVAALDRLQNWLREQTEVGAVNGLPDHLRVLNQTLMNAAADTLPTEQTTIEQLLFFGDSRALRATINADRSATQIALRLTVDETVEVDAFLQRLRAQLAALPQPLVAKVAGEAVLATESVDIVTSGQLQSIVLALLLIYACLALQFASFKTGLMATLPTLLQTAIYFGGLGLSGVTLNATTSLVECLVLGLAVDDTIHYLARFNHAARNKASESRGAVAALAAVLRPVTLTKAVLALGFLVLITGDLHNQVVFGWLAALTLVAAWLVDVLVTPAFMSGVRIVTLWDTLRVNLGADVQETIPLLSGLSTRQARVFALMANLQTVPAATRLMTEGEVCGDGTPGDPAGDIYVVIDGSLRVWIERDGQAIELNTLSRGAVVGEVGYFGQKRMANVDTLSDTRLLRFDDADQERICRQYPRVAARVFLNLNRLQAERRASTEPVPS
jgi:predicted RND superfamily exporter protein